MSSPKQNDPSLPITTSSPSSSPTILSTLLPNSETSSKDTSSTYSFIEPEPISSAASSTWPTSHSSSSSSSSSSTFSQIMPPTYPPPPSPRVRDLAWNILETFSKVTRASKQTAGQILDHPLARPFRPLLPKEIQHLSSTYTPATHGETVLEQMLLEMPAATEYVRTWWLQGGGSMATDSTTIHSASSALGRESEIVWHGTVEESECGDFEVLSTPFSLPEPVSKRSINYRLTKELWEKYQQYDFTRSFLTFPSSQDSNLTHSTSFKDEKKTPVSSPTSIPLPSTYESMNELEGELAHPTSVIEEIKWRIFRGGIDDDIRPHVWKFLLGYLPWGTTLKEQKEIIQKKTNQYYDFKKTCLHMSPNSMSESQWEEWEDRKHLIIKDVIRTDRQHSFFSPSLPISNQEEEDYLLSLSNFSVTTNTNATTTTTSSTSDSSSALNPHLISLMHLLMTYVQYLNEVGRTEMGYVQGMSDLCSGLLILFDGEEVDTFWCFVGLMERLHPNFHSNQTAMHIQLTTLKSLIQFIDYPLFKHLSQCDALNMFFAYRWLLVWFKREFYLPEIFAIWELCLCDYFSDDYALFIALALMDMYRKEILNQCHDFDQILKFVNELAYRIPVSVVLDRAEIVFQMYKNKLTLVQQMPTRFGEVEKELCKKLIRLDRVRK